MSGTIELNEFQALWNYIQQWKGVFEQFDQNRSGQIDFNELCNGKLIHLHDKLGFFFSFNLINIENSMLI